MDLKERIKELCKLKNISMNALEAELGFAKGYLSKLGSGGSTPNTNKIQRIADYFGVTIDYLMTGEERSENQGYYLNEETAQIAQDIFENKELRMLFDASRKASPEDLKSLHAMAIALKRKERSTEDEL